MKEFLRNAPSITETLQKQAVAIAGCGGLGSNIAIMLARIGIGELLLVDFDKVEKSNLNRQHYFKRHLGKPKVDALKEQIEEIHSYTTVKTLQEKVTSENACEIFKDYSFVCEAFDNAQYKASLVNSLLEKGGKTIVAASGMAGYGSADEIVTKRVFKNLFLVGDDKQSVYGEGIGLMAPRVMVCAAKQANIIVRLLMGNI